MCGGVQDRCCASPGCRLAETGTPVGRPLRSLSLGRNWSQDQGGAEKRRHTEILKDGERGKGRQRPKKFEAASFPMLGP